LALLSLLPPIKERTHQVRLPPAILNVAGSREKKRNHPFRPAFSLHTWRGRCSDKLGHKDKQENSE